MDTASTVHPDATDGNICIAKALRRHSGSIQRLPCLNADSLSADQRILGALWITLQALVGYDVMLEVVTAQVCSQAL